MVYDFVQIALRNIFEQIYFSEKNQMCFIGWTVNVCVGTYVYVCTATLYSVGGGSSQSIRFSLVSV